MTDTAAHTAARYGQRLARVVQFLLAGVAIITLVGGLLAGVHVIAYTMLAIFALAVFALVGVVELLLVRPLGRWSEDG